MRENSPSGGIAICLMATFISLLVSRADAQQQAKLFKIGWLSGGSDSGVVYARHETHRRALRELGYVEGKNIAFEYRFDDNKLERFPALANELVSLKVDVIVTTTTPAAQAAKNATRTIPVVFLSVADPVTAGLIDSLARPGGNVTGVTNVAAVLAGKRLELLKESVPKLSRVAVMWNPQNSGNEQQWKESLHPARELGLQLHSMEISSADKYDSAFKAATRARSAAVAVISSSLAVTNQQLIVNLAAKTHLPAIYPRGEYVVNGGLMSYGADQEEPFRRVASMVDKILKGRKPADIPVEQPMKFELMLNLTTAKALGLTIPPMVLMRATKVIK